MNAEARFVAHVDMDAFYASVELLRYPELRGQPLVIGGRRRVAQDAADPRRPAFPPLRNYKGRGVITTATYEARAFGVHSGMALMKAAKLAPDALLLPADFDEYRRYSRMFKDAVRALAPGIEDRGIDEIYVDLTGLISPETAGDEGAAWACARELAAAIQRAVREATGLSCSIGIAPNKLLAKIASELDKPGGLTVLREVDIPARLWPLPVRKIHGIGPKAGARLESFGIRTVGEAAQNNDKVGTLVYSDYGADFYSNGLGAMDDFIKQKPEVTRNFVQATMEGVKYTLAHPEEAVQMLKKHQPQLDEKTAVQEIAIIRKLINADNSKGPLGSIDKAKMQATQDLMVKYLDLKDPPPVADTYTNEFLS